MEDGLKILNSKVYSLLLNAVRTVTSHRLSGYVLQSKRNIYFIYLTMKKNVLIRFCY